MLDAKLLAYTAQQPVGMVLASLLLSRTDLAAVAHTALVSTLLVEVALWERATRFTNPLGCGAFGVHDGDVLRGLCGV